MAQIEYPPEPARMGNRRLPEAGDLAAYHATPEPALADVPTYEAVPTEVDVTTTPESAIETLPRTTAGFADLVVGGSLVSGGILIVTVTNQAQALPAAQLNRRVGRLRHDMRSSTTTVDSGRGRKHRHQDGLHYVRRAAPSDRHRRPQRQDRRERRHQ
jgi:hypothetical protein